MRNLVVKKKKGTKLWCHGTSREACRERKDGRIAAQVLNFFNSKMQYQINYF